MRATALDASGGLTHWREPARNKAGGLSIHVQHTSRGPGWLHLGQAGGREGWRPPPAEGRPDPSALPSHLKLQAVAPTRIAWPQGGPTPKGSFCTHRRQPSLRETFGVAQPGRPESGRRSAPSPPGGWRCENTAWAFSREDGGSADGQTKLQWLPRPLRHGDPLSL